ncbi:MAG: DUF1583 domain-containing protein, partial [Pirellulales bacterium]|nr:DUF1583 domain-containing protein [Pirellulales bacterium]
MLQKMRFLTLILLTDGPDRGVPVPSLPRQVILAIALLLGGATVWGQSDGLALDAIFAEQHVDESGIAICARSRTMKPEDRFAFLQAWVLPNRQHHRFRVTADFASANMPQPDAETPQASIVSPAIELIEVAVQRNRTGELRDAIVRCPVGSPLARCRQTALLTILAIQENDVQQSVQLLDEFFNLVLDDMQLLEQARASVLLCAWQAISMEETWQIAHEALAVITQHYLSEVRRQAWHRHLWAVNADLIKRMEAADSTLSEQAGDLSQWHRVSRSAAFEHGSAFPAARWRLAPGSARCLSSYGDDFLFFASPLRGNFEIQAEATGFGYRESQLMVAGTWVGLVYDHRRYELGNVRGPHGRVSINPPMTATNSRGFIHTRVKQQDGVISTFFNGRRIYNHAPGNAADPWVAVRSMYRVHGGVDDLRITGTPVIPATISLVDSLRLQGWYDYYQEPTNRPNRLANWRANLFLDPSGQPTTEISDAHQQELPQGCAAEQLLVYARPMLEDGSIEYEFWYAPGQSSAHPVLGRDCFLLEPGGVALHRISDGRFERSMRRPDNRITAQNSDPRTLLPLRPGTWNKMKLQLSGNELTLILNGQTIHQQEIKTERLHRTFGLFHYADRSALLVRNPRWTGDWPKRMPALQDQELAIYANASLDETSAQLTEVFQHRFDEHSILTRKFTVVDGDPVSNVQATSSGIVVSRDGTDGYHSALLAPGLRVGGDFDVTATFDQFECRSKAGNIGSVRISVQAANATEDLALIQRQRDRSGGQMVQCLLKQRIKKSDRRHYFAMQPLEAEAGRMRLSRRGGKIYYLVAENDSQQFRLLGEEEFT